MAGLPWEEWSRQFNLSLDLIFCSSLYTKNNHLNGLFYVDCYWLLAET